MKTKFCVWTDRLEERSKENENWTLEDIAKAYARRSFNAPISVADYDTLEEALIEYHETAKHLHTTYNPYLKKIEAELAWVEEYEVNEDGDYDHQICEWYFTAEERIVNEDDI